jgi:putative ABC transport system substrate-binding protein
MASHIGRRKFFATLGGVAAWPLTARGQPGERMHRIAFLHAYAENDPEVLARVVAFRKGLEALGWTESRNIRIEKGPVSGSNISVTRLTSGANSLSISSHFPIRAIMTWLSHAASPRAMGKTRTPAGKTRKRRANS